MILEIIKSKQCHVLFCEDEEVGGIGAEKFVKSGINPKVKFIVELDRRGSNDAVFYDCDNRDFIDFVCGYGFNEEFGSFSDISIIAPHLKTAAVNISSGYYNAHTQHEYISMNVVRQNINKVKRLIDNPTEHYEYIEATYSKYKFDTYPGWISDKYGDTKHVYSGWYDNYGTFTKKEYMPMRVEQLMYVDNDILVLDGGEPVDADYIMMDARGNLYEYDEYGNIASMEMLQGKTISKLANQYKMVYTYDDVVNDYLVSAIYYKWMKVTSSYSKKVLASSSEIFITRDEQGRVTEWKSVEYDSNNKEIVTRGRSLHPVRG